MEQISDVIKANNQKRNFALVRRIVVTLSTKGEGRFTSYLPQRHLYDVDLFDGGGPGHCPFSSMSNAIFLAMAYALESALEDEDAILTDAGCGD